jgi:rubrerythrin
MIFPFNAGEVFKIAIKIEENGRLFYEKVAAMPFPDMIKKLFQDLGGEELHHEAVFKKLMGELPPAATAATVWDPDNELDQYLKMMADQHVFNRPPAEIETMLKSVASPIDAVKMAIGFEKDTIVLFLELTESSDTDESKAQIRQLLDEERKHVKKLTDILKNLAG